MAYLFYLLSQFYFFFMLAHIKTDDQKSEKKFFQGQTYEKSLSSLSQIILCFLFWSIHKMSPVSEEKDLLDEVLNVSKESKRLSSVYDDEFISVLVSSKSEIKVSSQDSFDSEMFSTQKPRNKTVINST